MAACKRADSDRSAACKPLDEVAQRPGFTLLELLVVIAAVAFLATIAITALSAARMKSRDTQRLSDMSQISKAMELYVNSSSNNSYPTGCSNGLVSSCATLASYLPSIANLNDPSGVATACAGSAGSCNYAFPSGGVTATTYTVYFNLEQALGSTGSKCNKLTQNGVSACP